jgi:NADPH-dependent ferric siderophore reductase
MHAVSVLATSALTPRLRRITLGGPSLIGLESRAAQDVELVLTDESGRRHKRRYTIRTARPQLGEIDIDALMHPHGPGGRWASAVQTGARLELLGPRGKLELRPAGWYLFVADEAGLPAVAALLEALLDTGVGVAPAGLAPTEPTEPKAHTEPRVIVVAEVGDQSDEFPLPGADVHWLHRGTHPAGSPELIAAALANLAAPRELDADGQAYLLGESRAVVALRPHLLALGLPSERIFTKGYWNLGRLRAGQQ